MTSQFAAAAVVSFAVLTLVGVLVLLCLALRRYLRGPTTGTDNKRRLDGKVVVITGANTGIGKVTAEQLYERGARVIMVCRSKHRAKDAIADIKERCEDEGPLRRGELLFEQADLASLDSVRACANRILEREKTVHILINNAGIYPRDAETTPDGRFNLTWCTNHLGHFLLTEMLMPLLKNAAKDEEGAGSKPRVVIVSSVCHSMRPIDLDNLEYGKGPIEAFRSYSNSKLANVLYAKELSRRLAPFCVNVYSLHPGVIYTEIFRNVRKSRVSRILVSVSRPFFKTPFYGAQTTLFCALDEALEGESGFYYSDCRRERPAAQAESVQLQDRLREVCKKAVGIDPN